MLGRRQIFNILSKEAADRPLRRQEMNSDWISGYLAVCYIFAMHHQARTFLKETAPSGLTLMGVWSRHETEAPPRNPARPENSRFSASVHGSIHDA